MTTREHWVRPLDLPLPPAPPDPLARPVTRADAGHIAALMFASYHATPDDEGQGPADAAAETDRLLDGAYGPFDFDASEITFRGDQPASATLVTRYQGDALIAFSMTAPSWKRRGLARAGLIRTLARLAAAGHPAAHLAVTPHNTPARALYASLGFRPAPTA